MENADAGFQRGKQGVTYKKVLALVLSLVLFFGVLLLAFDVRLHVVFYSVETEKISGPVRLALLTDLHSCVYGKEQKQLVQAVEQQHPDAVLFCGDICDDARPLKPAESLLQALAAQYPCFYVTGNHEYWSEDIGAIFTLFAAYNVTVLQGNGQTLTLGGHALNIYGIDDPEAADGDEEAFMRSQLEALPAFSQNGLFTVLLAHRPEYISLYREYPADLILSGHAHGGQWRIPGLLNGLFSPGEGWFPRYAGGQYLFENSTLIVSRGLAKDTRVPRIFNRAELVFIDIVPVE